MKTETKVLGIGLLITAAVLIGGILLLSGGSKPSVGSNTTYQIDYSTGQKIGSDSAKVKLVEFSDLQCPACKAAEPSAREVISSFPPDKLQFVYKHFPLTAHKWSRQAANAAEAAGAQGKFWQMHDALFDSQDQWSNLADPKPYFIDIAKNLGLDINKFQQDLDKNTYADKVESQVQEGFKVGVNATPTFYLNGQKLSLTSFGQLKEVVGQEVLKNN